MGDDTVIITDSLSMAATTKALGIKTAGRGRARAQGRRRPRAVRHGGPGPVIDAVTAAIKSGRLPRAEAEAKVLRVLELKRKAGLAPAAQ